MRKTLRSTSAWHRGQTKIGISTRARLWIREVARELEEDIELGAEGDLNAAAPSTPPPPRPTPPRDEGDLDAALSVAHARLLATNSGRRQPLRVSASNPVPRSADSLLTAASAGGARRRFYRRPAASNGSLLGSMSHESNDSLLGPTSHESNSSLLGPTSHESNWVPQAAASNGLIV